MNKTTQKNKIEWENKILENTHGDSFRILEYVKTDEVYIEFLSTGFKRMASLGNIKKGNVADLAKPSVYNVGYLGLGKYTSKVNGVQEPCYKIWQTILQRCYNPKCSSYKNYGEKGVTICEEWKNYQNFAKWWEDHYKNWMQDWVIDKDILVKNNLTYSPETCCLVPIKINNIFTKRCSKRGDLPIGVSIKTQTKKGVVYKSIISQLNKDGNKIHLGCFSNIQDAFLAYKFAKESYIKEISLEYKELLEQRVYIALLDYIVEITD